MPSKEPRTSPVCQRPGIVNISQHLNGVHSICGQERKRFIRGGLVATELMTREPQSNIEKHIVFLDMLQRREVLRGELIRKARPEELKAILELCLNIKEGNLTMNITFCIHLIWLIKGEARLKRANALRKTLHLLQYP